MVVVVVLVKKKRLLLGEKKKKRDYTGYLNVFLRYEDNELGLSFLKTAITNTSVMVAAQTR